MPKRILSRFLGQLDRRREAHTGLTFAGAGAVAAFVVLSAGSASAQPAQPPPAPADPPPAQPAQPPPASPEPLMPPAAASPPSTPLKAPPPAPDPERDAKSLAKQGADRPSPSSAGGQIGAKPSDVFAEDWWTQARPVFEIHGYYRVRSELFHNFSLGRADVLSPLWPQPADNDVQLASPLGVAQPALHDIRICGSDPSLKTAEPCKNKTQAGANMRFRLNPELHVSDNLRVMAQIDMLDNVVLGSTPEGYFNVPGYQTGEGSSKGYSPGARGGYTPLGAFASTQWTPVAGVNSTTGSIAVKRVWGEYVTPIGLLRFGRMPSHWGLGMVANSGDGHDSDWQSTADRIMFVTGLKKYDLYFAGMWDFQNEGLTSMSLAQQQGQPYDVSQLDDVNQFGLVAVRRRNPELQRLELAKGQLVVNGGMYFVFRNQFAANDSNASASGNSLSQTSDLYGRGLARRGVTAFIPDVWLQVLYRKFRFEAEAAMIYGSIDSTELTGSAGSSNYNNAADPKNPGYKIRQFGVTTQSEFRAIEDRLRIQFGFGWASGDPGLSTLKPGEQELLAKPVSTDRTYSEFRFHPDYRVDLIFFRNILGRVQGAYYFRPSVEYDFTRDKNGQRIGGGATVIWSRASQFIQTPGHARDLGIELNGKLYFQSKDGTLNDDPNKMGGFYTSLEYGVFFPLGGLGYLDSQKTQYANTANPVDGAPAVLDTSTAQILRWYLGVLF